MSEKASCMIYALMIILKILHASNAKCGIVKKDNDKNGNRIIGGSESIPNQFPWQAYITVRINSGKRSFCGGSVISKRHILTAAHCAENTVM